MVEPLRDTRQILDIISKSEEFSLPELSKLEKEILKIEAEVEKSKMPHVYWPSFREIGDKLRGIANKKGRRSPWHLFLAIFMGVLSVSSFIGSYTPKEEQES